MTNNQLTKGELRVIADTDHVQCGDAAAMAKMLLEAMDDEPIAYVVHSAVGNLFFDEISPPEMEYIKRKKYRVTPLFATPQPALAVPGERESFESFMAERFGDLVDQRRAKNGDHGYMAWDMGVAWIVWQARAGVLRR